MQICKRKYEESNGALETKRSGLGSARRTFNHGLQGTHGMNYPASAIVPFLPRRWDRLHTRAALRLPGGPGQKRRNPPGGGSFSLPLHCASLTGRNGHARSARLAGGKNSSPQMSKQLRDTTLGLVLRRCTMVERSDDSTVFLRKNSRRYCLPPDGMVSSGSWDDRLVS